MSGWQTVLINGNSIKMKYRAVHIDADRQTDKQIDKQRNKQSHTATIKTISNHHKHSDKVGNKAAAGNTAVKPANTNTHINTYNCFYTRNKQQKTEHIDNNQPANL